MNELTSRIGPGSVITGGSDGSILLFDLRTADVVKSFKGFDDRIIALQHDPDTDLVIAAEVSLCYYDSDSYFFSLSLSLSLSLYMQNRNIKRFEMTSEECTHTVDVVMKLGRRYIPLRYRIKCVKRSSLSFPHPPPPTKIVPACGVCCGIRPLCGVYNLTSISL